MFDFSTLSSEKASELVRGFEVLSDVPGVRSFEWGTENNAEDSALGFTHCFILTFDSFDDRTSYLNSQQHREYEKVVMQYRSKVLVFDYAATMIK